MGEGGVKERRRDPKQQSAAGFVAPPATKGGAVATGAGRFKVAWIRGGEVKSEVTVEMDFDHTPQNKHGKSVGI